MIYKPQIFYLLIIVHFITGCAQFVPPTGGPKDETAPELIKVLPENQTKNFKGNTVLMEFNELIDATTLRQELIITPEPNGTYNLKSKPYGIELRFDQDFNDSTTYTFNFRNGVKDLNEKNPAENLKLVFSTGPYIDSLSIKGKVKDLWTNLPADKVTVALLDISKPDTIPLLLHKPNYFYNTDTTGNYEFENIKSSIYRLIAFTDKNLNLIFDEESELFGFYPNTIKLDSNIKQIDLNVYPYNISPPKIKRSLSRQTNFSVTLNKDVKDIKVEFIDESDSLTYQIRDKELLFFNHPPLLDTTLTKIIVLDSVGNILEHEQKVYFNQISTTRKDNPQVLRITTPKIRTGTKIKLPNEYLLNFEYPITNLDTSKIAIISDTTTNENFKTTWLDPSHTQLKIETKATAKREIKLQIESGSISNYRSDTNNTYTLINTLYQQDELASISGSFDEFSGNKIIQIIDSQTYQIIEQQNFTDNFNFPSVIPGTYRLRLIEDSNNNGQWDTAKFEENLTPERIKVSSGSIKLKANFELTDVQIN
ncbi:MAG: Ig-like domain-containing protein [Cytophagales bacterium]|nr:Ig-like domain-containing protein [Cytophagales bacterium]